MHVAVMIFLYYELPDPGCKWKKNLYFCKYVSFVFRQEKIQAVSANPEHFI